MAAEPISRAEAIERLIAQRIAAAGLRLRFDRTAVRLVDGVKAVVTPVVPKDHGIIFTLTAPIKHPARTRNALQSMLIDLPVGEIRRVVDGNDVRARRVISVSTDGPRVIGFVHNSESDAGLILNLAESGLGER